MKIVLWIFLGLVLLGGAGVGVAMWVKHATVDANQLAITVRSEQAGRGNLVETISSPGTIEAKIKVSISARVVARIIDLPFKEGDKVTKGDPTANPPIPPSLLVKLDSTDLEAQLRSAQARYQGQEAQIRVSQLNVSTRKSQIDSMKFQFADAERDLKRQVELLATKDVSQSIVDSAQAKVDQLRAQLAGEQFSLEGDQQNLTVLSYNLEAADAEIARAKDNLSYTTITSPIDGIVTRVNAQAGELVMTGTMNNAGTVIMEVADLSKMLMKARIDEVAIASVKVGQKAIIRIPAYQDREFEGTVTAVALADTTDAQSGGTKYFKAEILLDTKGDRIVSGLTADVDIQTAKYQDVVTVPSQAVLGRPTESLPENLRDLPEVDKSKPMATVVYRLIDGKAVITPVNVGASDVTRTVVKSGLKEGEAVIIGPFKVLDTLADGQAVKDERPSTKPATAPTTKSIATPATAPTVAPTTAPLTNASRNAA